MLCCCEYIVRYQYVGELEWPFLKVLYIIVDIFLQVPVILQFMVDEGVHQT